MEKFSEALKNFYMIYKKNFRLEYEANPNLKNSYETLENNCIKKLDNVKSSYLYKKTAGITDAVNKAFKINDLIVLDACNFINEKLFNFRNNTVLKRHEEWGKKIDSLFILPQYYGGIKDVNLNYYRNLYDEKNENNISKSKDITKYQNTIKNNFKQVFYKLKSLFKIDIDSDKIENYILPQILVNYKHLYKIKNFCFEEGFDDLKTLMLDMNRNFGVKSKLKNLRRTETNLILNKNNKAFECRFEFEIGNDQKSKIFFGIAKFRKNSLDNECKLTGISWTQ